MTSANLNNHETHPYPAIVPEEARALILGTFPAWESALAQNDPAFPADMIRYNYGRIHGSKANALWPLLGKIYGVELKTPEDIITFLHRSQIALADVYAKVKRKLPRNSSDNNLSEMVYNDALVDLLKSTPTIDRIFCTGKGVKKILESYFGKKIDLSRYQIVALPSPSRSADRTFGREPDFVKGEGAMNYRERVFRKYFPLR